GWTGALTERHARFFVREPVHPAGFSAGWRPVATETTAAAAECKRQRYRGLELATRLVRFFRQLHQNSHEAGVVVCFWIKEQAILREAEDRSDGAPVFNRRRTNDGNGSELGVKEVGWLGHDQVSLQCIAIERFGIRLPQADVKVRERDRGVVYGVGHCKRRGIAG